MACGKPVVASDTADFEILKKYNAGILVNPEDPEEVSNAIITLLRNKHLREEMGNNGRKIVISEYRWENTAMKIVKVFDNLLR